MLRRTGAWAYDRDVMARNKPATSVRSCSTCPPPPAGIKVPRPTAPQAPQVPPVYRPSMGPAAQPKIAGGAPVATPIKILPARTPPQLPPLDGPGAPRRPLVTPPQIPLGAVQQEAAAGTRTGVSDATRISQGAGRRSSGEAPWRRTSAEGARAAPAVFTAAGAGKRTTTADAADLGNGPAEGRQAVAAAGAAADF